MKVVAKEFGISSGMLSNWIRIYQEEGEESVKFRNIVNGRWHVNEPHKLVTSDMTMFKNKGKWYEWTLLVDAYNNEILAHSLTDRQGSSLLIASLLQSS